MNCNCDGTDELLSDKNGVLLDVPSLRLRRLLTEDRKSGTKRVSFLKFAARLQPRQLSKHRIEISFGAY